MNRRHVIDCMAAKVGKKCGLVLFAAILTTGLPGCADKDKAQDSGSKDAQRLEKPMTEAELTAQLHKEIDETQAAIDEAVQLHDKLAAEIAVMKQLLEETETELTTQEDEVTRMEALRDR